MKALLFSLLTLLPSAAFACDVCGAPATGVNYSLIDIDNLKFLQFSTTYSNFEHLQDAKDNDGNTVLNDILLRHSIRGSFLLGRNWSGQLDMPVVQSFRSTSGPTSSVQGIGDLKVQFQWQKKLAQSDTLTKVMRVSPFINLPTGKFMQRGTDRTILPIWLQTGTGSWGSGLAAAYTQKRENMGWSLQGSAQVFVSNERFYIPGARTSVRSAVFYVKNLKKISLMPELALQYDAFAKDGQYDAQLAYTGGERWSLHTGIAASTKQWALQLSVQVPLLQGIPEDQPAARLAGFASLTYFMEK